MGPHAGERLAHQAEGISSCRSLDGLSTGGNSAVVELMGKDLEVGDWIQNSAKEGIDVDCLAKFQPNFPMSILFNGICLIDALSHRLRDKAKVSEEFILGRR